MVTIIGLILAAAGAGQPGPVAPRERPPGAAKPASPTPGLPKPGAVAPPTDFLTGSKFHLELDQATSGSWTNVELRSLLNTLASERRVAILLDRRIDPTTPRPVDIVNRSLKDGVREIAAKAGAEISIPGNVIYVGPPAAAGRLRTLIELRSTELLSKTNAVREIRRNESTRPQTFSWEDLDTPGDILRQIVERYHLTMRKPELVPHDLWAGGTLPGVTAAEALSLVLIQFDLTFAWIDEGQGIELVPVPERVVIERRPRAKGRTAADTLKLIAGRFPNLEAKLDGADVLVSGTLEDHEAVAALLNPSSIRKPAGPTPAPLRQRIFTLTFKRAPVRDVMKKLEESGVVFAYDAAALTAAGVDLNQTVDLDLNKATADEFFKALFSPLKLSVEIDNLTVKLTPKK
jgi:hypothetical protein